ncbi:hypothetical protein M3Y95_00303500 [Aphelenchoides besseyi]|nr:hypothetical protein M3Y95_00303500 [Aphelenchoides besseyi]
MRLIPALREVSNLSRIELVGCEKRHSEVSAKLRNVQESAIKRSLPLVAKRTTSIQKPSLCFFCGIPIDNLDQFVSHLNESHSDEEFNQCPLCALTFRQQKLKHKLHFVDHVVEMHLKRVNNELSCSVCSLDFGNFNDQLTVYRGFLHMIYECREHQFCLLCLSHCPTDRRFEVNRLHEPHFVHRQKEHGQIYNRFLCSKCMLGFVSQVDFQHHECSTTFRCCCNVQHRFANRFAFDDHLENDDSEETEDHHYVNPLSNDKRWPLVPFNTVLNVNRTEKTNVNKITVNDAEVFLSKYSCCSNC